MTNYEHFHNKPLFVLLVLNGPNKRYRLNRVTKLSHKVKKDALYFRGIIWNHTTFPGERKAFKRKQ